MAGFRWGSHSNILLTVYKGLICSQLDWACIFTDSCCDTHIKKLDVIQFAALRTVLGVMKTTPTNVLLDLAKEPPLALRRNYLKQRFCMKVLACEDHPLRSSLNEGFVGIGRNNLKNKFNLVMTYDILRQHKENLITK